MGESNQAKSQILEYVDNIIVKEDNDEVLYGIAEALSNLAKYFKIKMIYLLEKLVAIEESVVRQKAVQGYVSLAKTVNKKELRDVLIPNVKKLSESSSLTTKISAIDIMTEMYPLCADEEKKVIRSRFNVLFGEDSLMVRRVLASKLGTLCGFMGRPLVVTELIKSFKLLSNDDSAKVRIITIDSLVKLAECLSEEENKNHMIPIIIKLTSDKSWRVRVHLASKFSDISKAVGPDVSDSLVSVFASLLRDNESLVRLDAVRALSKFVFILKPEKLSSLMSSLQLLGNDPVALVRAGVAELFQSMLSNSNLKVTLNKKSSLSKHIQTILKQLSKDDDLEVRLESFDVIKLCGDLLGPDEIEDLILSIYKSMDEASNWRLRLAGIDTLMSLAVGYANQSLFDQKFKKAFLQGIKDQAEQVRSLVINYIPQLASFLKDNYLLTYLTVEMLTIITEEETYGYQKRISAVYGVKELYMSVRKTDSMDQILKNQIVPLTEDGIANIRMVTVKMLKEIYGYTKSKDLKESIKKAIVKMDKSETDNETSSLISKFF
jgi:serine/threonine-protein phosphatase 2A regulatory subunit A